MNSELFCFADDTTGALDVGGALRSRGYEPKVSLGDVPTGERTDCTVIDQNSRYLKPGVSADLLLSNIRKTEMHTGQAEYYLKVDSTLRGNIKTDIEAVASILKGRPIFLAPSLPQFGRLCIDGIYYVDGVQIKNTKFAEDSSFRFTSSFLQDDNSDYQHITHTDLDRGLDFLTKKIKNSGRVRFTFDTRNQGDLELIASLGRSLKGLMVGSSGLARGLVNGSVESNNPVEIDKSLPVLFVVGSYNAVARSQLEYLVKQGTRKFEVNSNNLRARDTEEIKEAMLIELEQGKLALLTTQNDHADEKAQVALTKALGEVTDINEMKHNLVVVGGETARNVFQSRSYEIISIKGEFIDGVPISRAVKDNQMVITKAGGFGNETLLSEILDFVS